MSRGQDNNGAFHRGENGGDDRRGRQRNTNSPYRNQATASPSPPRQMQQEYPPNPHTCAKVAVNVDEIRLPLPNIDYDQQQQNVFRQRRHYLQKQQQQMSKKENVFYEAIAKFAEAAKILYQAAEAEQISHIRRLLMEKASEICQWAEALQRFVDAGPAWNTPPPLCASIGVDLTVYNGSKHTQRNGSDSMDLQELRTMHYTPVTTHSMDLQELRTMHYTPVTTRRPIDFTNDGYRLQCLQRERRPRLLIAITMYNEDATELSATLRKVCNNIAYLQNQTLPGYDGEDAWKNVVVAIVSDGRTKANPETLKALHQMGIFDEDAMTIFAKGLDTQMHIFERTVQLNRVFRVSANETFAEQIQPKYTTLLDVGTLPTKSPFYKLLGIMEMDTQIGGICGEIAVSRPFLNLYNIVIAAQHYEYKISNLLDKSLESCLGFISVLPGAFSAYRFKAIRGPPLDASFKSLTASMQQLGPFQGNMYLAEDRILCFELFARKEEKWTMTYVKDAIARTDVPTSLVDLINQRRRWLKGSFFTMLYTLSHWGRIYSDTKHCFLRKIGLLFGIRFAPYIRQDQFLKYEQVARVVFNVFNVFNVLYGLSIVVQIVLGLGNQPKHVQTRY